jgi:hypothetical protein
LGRLGGRSEGGSAAASARSAGLAGLVGRTAGSVCRSSMGIPTGHWVACVRAVQGHQPRASRGRAIRRRRTTPHRSRNIRSRDARDRGTKASTTQEGTCMASAVIVAGTRALPGVVPAGDEERSEATAVKEVMEALAAAKGVTVVMATMGVKGEAACRSSNRRGSRCHSRSRYTTNSTNLSLPAAARNRTSPRFRGMAQSRLRTR